MFILKDQQTETVPHNMSSQSDILSPDDAEFLYGHIPLDMHNIGLFDDDVDHNTDFENKINTALLPPVATGVLSNEEYAGPYQFEVDIHPNGSKNAWVYSSVLNKVYMTMRSPFPVDFKVKTRPNMRLFIRATPVYSAPQFAQDFVYRCINHEFSQEKGDKLIQSHIRQHILRCANLEATYLGDKEKNERLSVVIPFSFPQTGTENVREMFEFVCKNSCPIPGMNRRAIEVIFTLEHCDGSIVGRRMLNVRICSCPKRDKEKDENEYNMGKVRQQGKKRKVDKQDKKISINDSDCKLYQVQIPIVGRLNFQQVHKYCHDLMAGEIIRRANTGTEEPFKKCLSEINAIPKEPVE